MKNETSQTTTLIDELIFLLKKGNAHVNFNDAVNNVPFEDLVLRATQTFADLGVKKVIVLGQIPAWEDDLPKVLIRRFLLKRKSIPERTYDGVIARSLDMDRRLRELKFPPNVTYLSLKDLLCNDTGCLTKVGPDLETDLVVLDYGHLTEAGADFIGRNLLYQHLQ